MTRATAEVIPFPRTTRLRPKRVDDSNGPIARAIRERRLMSVIYGGAVEPQTFAPYVLYFDADQRVCVGGCEITKRGARWRDLDAESLRGIALTERKFHPGGLFSSKSNVYSHGLIAAVDMRH